MTIKQIANSLLAPDGSEYVCLTDGNGNLVTAGGGSSAIVVGTTTITGGTPGNVLFDNSGVVGEQAGGTVTTVSVTTANGVSGTVATATTTPAITLTLGAITPTTVAIGGGTAITSSGAGGALGSNAFTSTAFAPLASPTFTGTVILPTTTSGNITLGNINALLWTSGPALTAVASGSLRFGLGDVAAPIAQSMTVQGVIAGTTNTAGATWTINGSKSTGTGLGGSIVFQTTPAGTTGTAQNALATALTIASATNTMQPSVVVGNQAISTSATDGFLYIPTCAGTPTGTPTTFTGRVPMIFDTTNSQFWFFTGAAWKQPKTPAGAALVTWQ